MTTTIDGPLSELHEDALYRLLGDAWFSQLQFKGGESYYLGSAMEMGKWQFDNLAPMVRRDLARPYLYGPHACLAETIRQANTWLMPVAVVTELASRVGFTRATVDRQPNFVLVHNEV